MPGEASEHLTSHPEALTIGQALGEALPLLDNSECSLCSENSRGASDITKL
jgi:hypothetical protein